MKKLFLLTLAATLGLVGASIVIAAQENPVPVRTVKPTYPREMRAQGVSGMVMVKCTIDEQGNVSEAAVAKSTNQAFDSFALEALKKWKFKPARQDGVPVAMQVSIPVKFVLEES